LRIYNRYIVSLVVASCLINVLLASLGQNDLVMYFLINVLVYLMITLLFSYLNPRVKRSLNAIGAVFFAGFMVTVVIKVVDILSGK